MNYYFDFDNTIYETAKLTELMLRSIAKTISENSNQEYEELIKYVKENFNSTVDNIFSFSSKVAEKFEVNSEILLNAVNKVVNNGRNIVFEDARRFIEKLKQNEQEKQNKLYLLTYTHKGNEEYQLQKIIGADVLKYFDGLIVTTEYKFNLDLKYDDGVFFDDDPRDLNGLLDNNAYKVIRIRKVNNWRSKIDMENPMVEEYSSFDDIKV